MGKHDNIEKISAQGVRDYPVTRLKSKNEDLDDVYDHIPTNQTSNLESSKEVVSEKTILNKKRRGGNKNHSVDLAVDEKEKLHNE